MLRPRNLSSFLIALKRTVQLCGIPTGLVIAALKIVALAGAVALAGVEACTDNPPTTNNNPAGVTLTITSAVPIIITPGTSTVVNVAITRINGYTGPVTLSARFGTTQEPVEWELHLSAANATIPAEATTGSITVVADGATPTGTTLMRLLAYPGGTGYTGADLTPDVAILHAGEFTLTDLGVGSSWDVFPGTTSSAYPIGVDRNQFNQAVTFSAAEVQPSGLTFSYVQPGTGIVGSIQVTAPANATANGDAHRVTLTATAPGAATQQLTLDVFVTSLYQLTYNPTSLSINQGATANVAVTAARDPGNTAPITITTTATVTGITSTPLVIPGTQGTLVVAVDPSVPAGNYTVVAHANQPGGLSEKTTSLSVQVNAVGYALSVQTAPLNVTAGTSQPDVVNLVRTSFTGAVAVTATTDDPNITVSVNPATATTGNSVTLTVTVALSGTGTNGGPPVTAGTHTITLKGTSSLTDVPAAFAVVVALPTGGAPVSLAMAPSGTTAIHLANGATQKFTSWLVDAAGNRTTPAGGTSFGIVADVSSVLAMPTATFDATQQLLTATGTAGANGSTAVRALYLNSSNGQSILPSVTASVIVP